MPEPTVSGPVRCFISYRRADSAADAGRLYDALAAALGTDHVFMDVDTIAPGRDFIIAIEKALVRSDVVLAVIGGSWLGITDAEGNRRLDDDEDFVRAEITTALRIGVSIVPVLVGGATMPPGDQLPDEMKPLARRNALVLDHSRWHADVGRLLTAIEELASSPDSDDPIQIPVSREALRRVTVVSIAFDITGKDGHAVDVELVPAIEGRLIDQALASLRRNGASAFAQLGHVIGIFGVPVAHEDDALRALRSADDLRSHSAEGGAAQSDAPVSVSYRCGIRTGLSLVGMPKRGANIAGTLIAEAASLRAEATAGEIRFDGATLELAGSAIEQAPAGSFFRLISITTPTLPRDHAGALIGREGELNLLKETFERTRTEKLSILHTVLGEAGVGKSRLLLEFFARLPPGVVVFQGRCLPYGEGLTYWPIAEALRGALAIGSQADAEDIRAAVRNALESHALVDRIAPVVEQVLGVTSGTASMDEISWALREILGSIRGGAPSILVIDDLQWGAEALLDFLVELASHSGDQPILIVTLARPELKEMHPGWPSGAPDNLTTNLEPLGGETSAAFLEARLGGPVDTATAARLLTVTGGNALFLEELTQELIENEELTSHGGVWSISAEAGVDMPAAIEALLVSRLDRIPDQEREVLERASVVGQGFTVAAVEALHDGDTNLGAVLDHLLDRDLIRRSRNEDDDAFEFRHLLLRDAAYRGVPKTSRLSLHARFATWLEETSSDRLVEIEEIIGYHFEQAVLLSRALDRTAEPWSERAAFHLGSAGKRALDRSDMRASASLLARARAMLTSVGPLSVAIDIDRSEALREMGDLQGSTEILRAAKVDTAALEDPALAARVDLTLSYTDVQTESTTLEEAQGVARSSIGVFEALHDNVWLAKAHRILGTLKWWEPDFRAAIDSLREGLRYAEIAGDSRETERILAGLTHAWVWDDTPASQGLQEVDDVLALGHGRVVEGKALQARAGLLALLDRSDEAIATVAEARRVLEELGMRHAIVVGVQIEATVHLLGGDLGSAEAALREAIPELEQIGDDGFTASAAAQVAYVLALQGRFEESRTFVDKATSLSDPADLIDRSVWGAPLALDLAEEGLVDQARQVAEEASQTHRKTGLAFERGVALLVLARICKLGGDTVGAIQAATAAKEVFAQKEAIPAVRWAVTRLAEASEARPPESDVVVQ